MESLLGTTLPVFFAVTVVIIGFAAYMAGQAVANTWGALWQVIVYCALMGCASRFLIFALFDGQLLSLSGYVIDTAVLMIIGAFAFRLTRAHKMVAQYPWLYERVGVFGWRSRH
jgi:hypothetical protein